LLQRLQIQNYAIIDQVEIDFSSGLNVITGETGAGKSILMGALALILGERADTSVLRAADKKCFIEGHFTLPSKEEIKTFLAENELEQDEILVLRREISSNGKSRAFINDTPATLQQIKQLASLLVDLHQQFDTLELGDAGFQRTVIDALASNENLLKEYKAVHKQWQASLKKLQQLQEQKNNFNKEADYNQFLYDELHELSLQENELEELDQELKLLSDSENVKTALTKVYVDLERIGSACCFYIKAIGQPVNSVFISS
jgi:DNA repair protein RecN (Recombination protein N)